MRARAFALIFLTFLGLIDTLYLGLKRGKPVACSISVPISWFGFAFYLAVFSCAVFAAFGDDWLLKLVFWPALAAFLVSAGLVGIQAFVLEAYCQYCLGSAALSTLILIFVPKPWHRPGSHPGGVQGE
jgi:uncharacterized membrane protein